MPLSTISLSKPRVLVLGGSSERWKASDDHDEAEIITGIEAWVHTFGGDYLCGKDATAAIIASYDIIIGNTNFPFIPHLAQLAESRPQSTKWVSLIERSGLDYIKPLPGVPRIFDASDLVVSINKYSTELFRMMTTTKVEYIGLPFPAENIRKLSTPIEKRRREIYLCPLLLSRWSEVYVARRTGIDYYGVEKKLSRQLKTIMPNIRKHGTTNPNHFFDSVRELYSEPNFKVERERNLAKHFRIEGGTLLWLNFDERYTWGRNVLDAAALQVPVISTRSTGHQEDFFPELLLETPFELEKAFELTMRLIEDDEFYREISTIPLERFEHLRPEVMKKKLLNAIFE